MPFQTPGLRRVPHGLPHQVQVPLPHFQALAIEFPSIAQHVPFKTSSSFRLYHEYDKYWVPTGWLFCFCHLFTHIPLILPPLILPWLLKAAHLPSSTYLASYSLCHIALTLDTHYLATEEEGKHTGLVRVWRYISYIISVQAFSFSRFQLSYQWNNSTK